ncbi:MAG: hypothetical protein AB7S93_06535 [Xanthobacteraceae bacterium]
MRTGTTLMIKLRLVFAVLFAAISAVPMPARALIHAPSIRHMHAAPAAGPALAHAGHNIEHRDHGANGHHHGHLGAVTAADDAPSAPQLVDGVIPCHSAACCIAVTQCLPSVPATVLLLLGRLVAQPTPIIVAVTPDPVVPPPRLQA